LCAFKDERNILHTINGGNTRLIGHILHRHCPEKHVVEENIGERREITGR
jgi:hypothetical protein